jgi:peptidyl-prolyl cis-trans isomerase SurA
MKGPTIDVFRASGAKAFLWSFLGVAVIFAATPVFGREFLIDRIVAHINDTIITERQYDLAKEQLRDSLEQQYSGAELEQQYKTQERHLLEQMIDQDLLVQKAKDLNINVDAELVEYLDRERKQFGLASIQPDLENLVEKNGIIWEDYENDIRKKILTQQVIEQRVGSLITVTQAEAKKYFDAHKQQFQSPAGVELAEIQISKDKWGNAAEKRAQAAYAMVQGGATWSDVLKKYSDGPQKNNGDIGFFPNGSLLPVIASAVNNLDPGDSSKVIPLNTGYVIVKVLDQRSPGPPKFQEVEEKVDDILYNQKMQPALKAYLTKLRTQSCISIDPGFVDAGAPPQNGTGTGEGCE